MSRWVPISIPFLPLILPLPSWASDILEEVLGGRVDLARRDMNIAQRREC
jgi:hypothetical protein